MCEKYQGIDVLVKGIKGQQLLSLPMDNEELAAAMTEIGAGIDLVVPNYQIIDIDVDGINERWLRDYDVAELNNIADALDTVDVNGSINWLAAYIEATGYDIVWAIDHYDDSIYYGAESLEDIAYDIVDDCYELPQIARDYFDYGSFGRDMVLNGELVDTDYGYISVY